MPAPSRTPTRVRVLPRGLSGVVRTPGDKSLSHRALILGALVGEPVEVAGLAPSEDVRSTAEALRCFGVGVELHPDADGQLEGAVAGPVSEPTQVVDCGNSGTALRLLAGMAAGTPGLSVLTGDASLRGRPVDRVAVPLGQMGAMVAARAGGRLPPLVVQGGALHGIAYRSPVASAQVKSAILLAGLAAAGPVEVVAPLPSRDHTERLLRYLGRDVETTIDGDLAEHTRLGAGRLRPRPIRVARDPSSAAFWLVAAAVGAQGATVTADGIALNPGRTGALEVLRELGADVEVQQGPEVSGEPTGTVTVRASDLGAAEVRGRRVVDAIDELPILALAGAMSQDGLVVRDAAELRVKESDRIEAVAAAFAALGLVVETDPDGFRVPGGQRPSGGTVDAGGDHRIAMTAAVAATVAGAPVEISGFGAVPTSYPTFLADLAALGGAFDVLEEAP